MITPQFAVVFPGERIIKTRYFYIILKCGDTFKWKIICSGWQRSPFRNALNDGIAVSA